MKTKTTLILWTATLCAVIACITMLMRPAAPPQRQIVDEPNLFPFVHSLQGTSAPDVNTDDHDGLVADAELRQLFDYYLSAASEATPQAIREKIEQELDRTLKPRAAVEAKRLLGQYLAFRDAVMEMQKNPPPVDPTISPIRARLMAIREIRTHYFTPEEIKGMFGFDDEHAEDALARVEITRDKSLTLEQKKQKLAKLDAAMSPELKAEREAPLKVAKMEEAVAAARANGASDDDVYHIRAKIFSPEAASRLAELDTQTADWKRRIGAYQADRRNVLANNTLSDADKQSAIQQLRDAQFSGTEQMRLAAYE
jgi:lipase chaperone LimK